VDSSKAIVGEKRWRVLDEAEWQALAEAHEAQIGPYVDAYRARRSSRQTHPVHDFLFSYYQANRRSLRRWRPGPDMVLQGEPAETFLQDRRFCTREEGVGLDFSVMELKERKRLEWMRSLLLSARARTPRFNCFGLHEWAMVYKSDEVRHESTPLRLSNRQIAEVVESSSVRCTHWDAFRFFTPEAVTLNEIQPEPDRREDFEQFGCIHFNMDLYRWSYKGSPWIGSDLLRDCFLSALDARELDMRASPYDLSEYGYEAIEIETAQGREAYRQEQQRIYQEGQMLADRLIEECDFALAQSSR